MKNRGVYLIAGTIVLLIVFGSLIFVVSKPVKPVKGSVLSYQKVEEFRNDAFKLDTLCKNYKKACFANDVSQTVLLQSLLKQELSNFHNNYCKSSAAVEKIALKVYKNYFEMITIIDSIIKQNQKSNRTNKDLQEKIIELEKANQELSKTVDNLTLKLDLLE